MLLIISAIAITSVTINACLLYELNNLQRINKRQKNIVSSLEKGIKYLVENEHDRFRELLSEHLGKDEIDEQTAPI